VICLDASVVAKLVLPEEHSDLARALYSATVTAGEPIVAPDLLPFEVTNIIRKRMVREGMSLADADLAITEFQSLAVTLTTPPEIHREALELTDACGLRAAYDAHYVVLARRFDCDLWTDDEDLIQVVGKRLSFVRAISSYAVKDVTEDGTE
jgi:predicted nucleic acid-binding protein